LPVFLCLLDILDHRASAFVQHPAVGVPIVRLPSHGRSHVHIDAQIEEAADKDDLIGAPEGAKRLFFSSKLAQKQHIFTLGERAHILKELEETVILPHVADKRHDRFHLEVCGWLGSRGWLSLYYRDIRHATAIALE
jgi:hypothetical protein